MSIRYKKNMIRNISKLYTIPMRELRIDRITVIVIYGTKIFDQHLTDYLYNINSLCPSDIRKT